MVRGWHGDRIRHGLASRGVKTSFNPNVVQYRGNIYLESDGILYRPRRDFVNSVNGQLKCLRAFGVSWDDNAVYMGIEPVQEVAELPDEPAPESVPIPAPDEPAPELVDSTPPPPSPESDEFFYSNQQAEVEAKKELAEQEYEKQKEIQKSAEAEAKHQKILGDTAEKQLEAERKLEEKKAKEELRKTQVEAGTGMGGAIDMTTKIGKALWKGFKDFVSIEPSQVRPKSSTGLGSNKNTNLGQTVGRRTADTNRPTDPSKMNDVTKEMYKSIDSDSIIATVENKEKLIAFANDLEHDINLLGVSYKKNYNDFQTEERKDARVVANEIRKAQADLKEEIQLTKTSGQPKSEVQYEINNLKIGFQNEVDLLKDSLKNQQLQNRADLKYIDDLRDDLAKLHRQTDQRIKMMVASGQRK